MTQQFSGAGAAILRLQHVPFSDLPGQSKLFLEYLRDPRSLARYYPNAVDSVGELGKFAPQVLSAYTTDRQAVCDSLVEINVSAGAGEATMRSIDLLRGEDTVAVVTGQQAGLFSGPLYTIYKALTAIKIAEQLNAGGTNAVPVFWAATEDHDLDEVASTWFVDASGSLARTDYRPGSYLPDSPVGSIVIDEAIRGEIEGLFAALPETQYTPDVRDILDTAWSPGTGFGGAFIRTIVRLLGDRGLIMVDPMHSRLKALAAPFVAEAIGRANDIVAGAVGASNALVKEGYHAQVLVEPDHLPLFMIDEEGKRRALRKVRDGAYRLKGGRDEILASELARIVTDSPARISPAVLLRPVVQDHLFPTVCYIGGAAEVAYFAQISAVYKALARPVTPIMHRQSLTLVDPRQQRALDKLGLSFEDLFEGKEALTLKLSSSLLSPETASVFDGVERTISGELDRLEERLENIDPTVAANLATRRRKIEYHLTALRQKALRSIARKDSIFRRRLDGLYSSVLPNGVLQERMLNVFSFVNFAGLSVIDRIYDAIDVDNRDHCILEL